MYVLRLHIAVLTSSMSLMRSWADCFLLRVPPDSVRSRGLMRGEEGSDWGGGASREDDDARPAIVLYTQSGSITSMHSIMRW